MCSLWDVLTVQGLLRAAAAKDLHERSLDGAAPRGTHSLTAVWALTHCSSTHPQDIVNGRCFDSSDDCTVTLRRERVCLKCELAWHGR